MTALDLLGAQSTVEGGHATAAFGDDHDLVRGIGDRRHDRAAAEGRTDAAATGRAVAARAVVGVDRRPGGGHRRRAVVTGAVRCGGLVQEQAEQEHQGGGHDQVLDDVDEPLHLRTPGSRRW